MHVLVVEFLNHARGVGVILVPHGLAHDVPPEPILDDVVQGDVHDAVFFRNAQKFLLRGIAILTCQGSRRPVPEHGRGRQFAIGGDDGVEFRAVEKVIVHGVRNFGAEVERVNEAMLKRLREPLFQKMP